MQDGDASYVVYTALFLLLLKLFFEMSGNKTVTEIDAWENIENGAWFVDIFRRHLEKFLFGSTTTSKAVLKVDSNSELRQKKPKKQKAYYNKAKYTASLSRTVEQGQ